MAQAALSCVFVHGWGMNQAIWQPVLERLPGWIDPIVIDLPGHGLAADGCFNHLQDLVDMLGDVTNSPSLWIGWSLGGLPVMQLALQRPQLIKGMMLVASSPCFVMRSDWHCGMRESVFDGFGAELATDFSGTIKRFLSLQVKGSESGRQILKQLRANVLNMPAANPRALMAGLQVLKQIDLRTRLVDIHSPVYWLLGEHDGLVQSSLAEELAHLMPDANVKVQKKAAHAPFLSHVDEFVQQLKHFAETLV